MELCICGKEFKNFRSLNSHKRFCKDWQSNKQSKNVNLTLEERKSIKSVCPNCKKEFKNIFSMSSHKGHCLGITPKYEDYSEEAKKKMLWSKGKTLASKKNIFCQNSNYSTSYAKKAIINYNLKEYICNGCNISEWNGKFLVLELDHINGDNRDHRLENLRLLCPNCHSQTSNWRGRNKNTGKIKVTDNQLLEALQSTASIRQALLKVGLTAKGANYKRCKKLLNKFEQNELND